MILSYSYLDERRDANVFVQLKIAWYENVNLHEGSLANWAGRGLHLA